MNKTCILTFMLTLTVPFSSQAANFNDPTWPCIQRKVPRLSIGQMWIGKILEDSVEIDADTRALANAISVRRTTMEDAQALIAKYADGLNGDRATQLAMLFKAAFEKIDRERSEIVSGIARYAGKQTGLAERIDMLQQEVAALEMKEDKSDDEFDKMEELQDIVAWDARIYKERAQSLTFVCETPVILEKRAFALARAIMAHANAESAE